jgi:hypothetical protein
MARPRDVTKRKKIAILLRQGKSARAIMATLHCGSRMVAEVRRDWLPALVIQIAASIRQIQADIAEIKEKAWKPVPPMTLVPPPGVPLPPPPPGGARKLPPPSGRNPLQNELLGELKGAFAAGAVKPSLVVALRT